VSRNHAELHRRDDGWHIVDLGSTNGIRVNEEVVTSAPLRTSDVLEIGEVRFRFVEY
jgi:pSer/pThr/pTyr-binding forkhead associated (FHA) protein